MKVSLEQLKDNPYNTRTDYGDLSGLATTFKRFGVTYPLLARKGEDGYQLAFGSRRLRALREAGITEVEVEEREISNADMTLLSLCENIHRKDLNPVELARGYNVALKVSEMTIPELAEQLGDSETKIRNYLLILNLPERALKDPENYNFIRLFSLAKLNTLSPTLMRELENVFKERSLPSRFLSEITQSCTKVFEARLPDKKKIELSMRILWEDYTNLPNADYKKIPEFANHLLGEAVIVYNERLKKTERAREFLKRSEKGKIDHVTNLPNYDRNLDRVTELLKTADIKANIAYIRGDYKRASKRSRSRFNYWAEKLISGLEKILEKNGNS